ncbi:MAG: hypothetical protein Q4B04_06600, partial [bacterium]|nr:hypothetical protein [bacterium]
HTNASAYQYRYNRVNFDPYFGEAPVPPAEPTVDWLASKVQLAVGTTAASDSTSMRILSTVDSLDYDAAGIEITINGKTTTLNSTVVYESIYAASGEGAELVTPVQVSGVEDSQYIIAKEIINIPAAAFDTEITIRAFCSVDETVSYGESRTVTVAGLI